MGRTKQIHLRAARKAARLTQTELAHRLGVHQSRISKLEQGQIDPTLDEAKAIARILHIDLMRLQFGQLAAVSA